MTAAILDFKAIKKRMQELDAPQAHATVDVNPATGDYITVTMPDSAWSTGGIVVPYYPLTIDAQAIRLTPSRCETIAFAPMEP